MMHRTDQNRLSSFYLIDHGLLNLTVLISVFISISFAILAKIKLKLIDTIKYISKIALSILLLCLNSAVEKGYGQSVIKELDPLNLSETNSRIVHTENINSRLENTSNFKAETITGSFGKISISAGGLIDYVSDSINNNLAEGGKYSEVFRLTTTDNVKIDLPINIVGTNDSASISKLEYVIDASQDSISESASGTLRIKDEDTGQSSFVAQSDLAGSYGKFSLSTKGEWSYLSNSSQSSLLTGESVSESFTVSSIDGTKRDISITIKGTKNIEPTIENEESYYEVSESNGLTLRKQLLPDSQKTYYGGLSKVKIKLIQGKRYRFVMRGLNFANLTNHGSVQGNSTISLYMPNDTVQIASNSSDHYLLDPQIIITPHTSGVHLIECINTNSEFESIGLCELFVEHIEPNKLLNENVALDAESKGDLAMPMEWENAPNQLETNQVDASTQSGYSCKINKPLQVRKPHRSLIIESYVNTAFKGAINKHEDIDFIKINLKNTKTYFIEVCSDYFQPNLSLLDTTGQMLERASYFKTIDSLTKTLTIKIDSDDDYYLKINPRFSRGYGEYVVKILEFKGYDENTNLSDITDFVYSPLLLSDLPDTDVVSGVQSQETLNAGETISGSIEIDSDKDWYKLFLEKDSIYKWELRSVTLNKGMFRLRNSKGELIDHEFAEGWVLQSDKRGDLVYKAKKTGSYFIEIYSDADIDPNQLNKATGSYNLIFSKLTDDVGGDYRDLYVYDELSYINDFKDSAWTRKWDSSGWYDLVNFKNAGVLQVGQRLYGNIYEASSYLGSLWGGDYDVYGVEMLAKNTYIFSQYTTSTSTGDYNNGDSGNIALLNDSGDILTRWGEVGSTQGSPEQLSYKPERDGYYYLLVSAYGQSRSTDYMIWSDFYGDDYPNTIRTDGYLNFDNPVSGKIDRANDSDWFKVKLKKDDYYEFSYQSGNSSTGIFSLFGPVETDNGILLNYLNNYENYSSNWRKFLEQTPIGSGRQVPDVGNTIADAFRIDPFSKLIDYGLTSENVFSSLSADDKDFYSISLDATETYQINLIGKKIDSKNYKYDALSAPKLVIYNSQGNILPLEVNMGVLSAHDGDEFRDVEIKFSPPETDDYYFEISSDQMISDGQKAYALAINKLPVQRLNYTEIKNSASIRWRAKNTATYFVAINGDNKASYDINANNISLPINDSIGESVDNAASYTLGNEISTQIDYEGDHDWFEVQLEPGETYKIQYNHENTQLEKSSRREPKDGLLVIRDSFGKVLGTLDIWKLINSSGGFWGTRKGRFLRTDWAKAGESLEFYFSTALDKQKPSSSKSTYYIDVFSSLVGEMKFSLVKLNDDQKESIATTGLLEVGGSASGTWENGVTNGPNLTNRSGHNYNDGDWFKINLISGNTYKIDIYSDPLTNPYLLLYNEMGSCLNQFGGFWPFPGSDDYGYNSTGALKVETLKDGHSQLTFTADRTGEFFVNAHNRHYRPGNHIYDLSLVHIPDAIASSIETSAVLAVDDQATATLERVNDRDWFKITLNRGSIYKFDVLGNSLKDPTIRIRDSHGRQLYYNDQINGWWNPSINYTAFEDGVYYVDVGGIDSGQYALKCTKLYSPPEGSDIFIGTDLELNEEYLSNSKDTAAAHTIGNIVQGEITQAGDRKWHRFKLEESHTYEFQLFGDSLQAPILNLRDTSGEISIPKPFKDKEKTSGDKLVLKYVAPKTDFYYLEVGGYWSSGAGANVKGVPTGTFTLKTSDFGLDSARAVMWEKSFSDAKDSAIDQSVGTTISGSIEHAANRDLYKLSLIEGAVYTFKIDAGLSDGTFDLGVKSRLLLHDQDGALLIAVNEGNLVYKATQSATYHLAVGATTGQNFGNKFRANSVVPFNYSVKAIQSRAPKIEPTVNWIATLNDASILNHTIAAMDDGLFSRTEILEVLESVKGGGLIEENELKDLRILVANYKSAGLSNYIATLLDNITNGDPANQYYTGRDANNNGKTTRQDLGNLYFNSSSDRLEKLISKWFLGTDSPAVPSLYVKLDYPLFFNGAGTDDVNQGAVGDCYFLSSISSVADSSVASIDGTVPSVDEGDMIIDNGDGTFGIRFYDNNGAQRWVTVDKYVPGYREDKLNFASSDSGESWPMLIEKAYVQLNESDNIGQDGTNRYGIGNNFGIAGGSAGYALSHVTGQKSSYVYLDEKNTTFTSEKLREIIDADLPIIFSTSPPCQLPASYGVVCSHTYSIEEYDSLTGKYHLRNAWGFADAYVTFEALKLMGSQLHFLDGSKTKMERINPEESTFSASDGSVEGSNVDTDLFSVESTGVKLFKDSQNNLYAGDNSQQAQPVTVDGNLLSLTLNGRTAIAAEKINGVNKILWKNNSSGDLIVINFDSSWQFSSSNNSSITSGSIEFSTVKEEFGLPLETPQITWVVPSPLNYGTRLSEVHLNPTTEVPGRLELSHSQGEVLPAGEHTLKVDFYPTDQTTYRAVSLERTINVNKASLTISVADVSRIISTQNPNFVITYNGFVNNETKANLISEAVATTTATTSSEPGDYPITLSGAASNNYAITYVSGVLKVSDKFKLTLQVPNSGSVSTTPNKELFDAGDKVKLEAIASKGFAFISWEGSVNSSENPLEITINENTTIKAKFAKLIKYTGIVIEGKGKIEIKPDLDLYLAYTPIELLAIPAKNYEFVKWTVSGFLLSEKNPFNGSKVPGSDMEVQAHFRYVKPPEPVEVKVYDIVNAPFGFRFNTEKDTSYEVQSSDDMRLWNQIQKIQGTGKSFKFVDPRKAYYQKQYYRVKVIE